MMMMDPIPAPRHPGPPHNRARLSRWIASIALTAVAGLALASRSQAQPYGYVANLGDDEVSVIDLSTATIVATLPAGDDPDGIAVSSDGRLVLISNFLSDDVTVVDSASQTVVATVPVSGGPVGIAIHPDGDRAFVAEREASTVSIIDTASAAVTSSVGVAPGPDAVAIDSAGRFAIVTSSFTKFPGVITYIDNLGLVAGTVAVQRNPNRVAIAPDGHTVYVANFRSFNLSVLDLESGMPITTVRLSGRPSGVAVNPNGSYVYVTTLDGFLQVIDTVPMRLYAKIEVGQRPSSIAVTRNGATGYVTNFGDDNLTVLDLARHTVTGTIDVGARPFAMAVNCVAETCNEPPLTAIPTETPTETLTPSLTPTFPLPPPSTRPHRPTSTPQGTIPPRSTHTPLVPPSRGSPTATRTPNRTDLSIVAADVTIAAGGQGRVDFSLRANGNLVAAVELTLLLPPFVRISETGGCAVNPAIDRNVFVTSLKPNGCDSAVFGSCDRLAVLVLDFRNLDPIADGARLFSCTYQVNANTPAGTYPILTTGVAGSDPGGAPISGYGPAGRLQVPEAASTRPAMRSLNKGIGTTAGSTLLANGICSGGGDRGSRCSSDSDCSFGFCVIPSAICDGGDDDGLICDCPGGTCGGDSSCSAPLDGRCDGGTAAGDCCRRELNCADGAPCTETLRLCAGGISKGLPCTDSRHCLDSACEVSPARCSGGDFDGFACVDGGDCPLGECKVVGAGEDRTRKPSKTLRPTRTPIGEDRTRRPTWTTTPTRPSFPLSTPPSPTPQATSTIQASVTAAPPPTSLAPTSTAAATATNKRTATRQPTAGGNRGSCAIAPLPAAGSSRSVLWLLAIPGIAVLIRRRSGRRTRH